MLGLLLVRFIALGVDLFVERTSATPPMSTGLISAEWCDHLWPGKSVLFSSASLQDAAADACQKKPDILEFGCVFQR
jgi:hypothetical protein